MSMKTAKDVGAHHPMELPRLASESVGMVELVSKIAVVVQCRPFLAINVLPPCVFFLHDCPLVPAVLLGPIKRDVSFTSFDFSS